MNAAHILVVEDDKHLAESLERGLREAGFTVTRAATIREARGSIEKSKLAVVVLDLNLPDEDGLKLLTELRGSGEKIPVIVTTARGRLEQRVAGLTAGADDYLVKPYAFAELIARIHVQLRHTRQQQTRDQIADLKLDVLARTATRDNKPLELTPREWDLLVYLLAAEGRVVTREMLARDVWKVRSWTLSMDNVIDVHISRLREKIDRNHPVKLLHTVRGVGFALKEKT
jgi:DNA-binding response OmpR family regulator